MFQLFNLKHHQLAIILTNQRAYMIDNAQSMSKTTTVIELPKLSKQLATLNSKTTIYWILLNNDYQIIPQKYRLGGDLKLSEKVIQKITEWWQQQNKDSDTITNYLKNNVFAFEQLIPLSTNSTIHLSAQITRLISYHRLLGVTSSRLSVSSTIELSTSVEKNTKLEVDDVIAHIVQGIKSKGFGWLRITHWRRSVTQLFLVEILLLALLLCLALASFLLHQKPEPNLSPQLIKEPFPTRQSSTIREWHFSQLSHHLMSLRQLFDPLQTLILQTIEFDAPTLFLSGYWQKNQPKYLIHQEWDTLIEALHQNPKFLQIQVLRNPLQGNLSQSQSFQIKLQLNKP